MEYPTPPARPEVAAELEALRRATELRDARDEKRRKRIIVVVLLAVLALVGLWSTGRMDSFLVNVGLNKNDCVQNAFGATFCGGAAKAYGQAIGADLSPSDMDAAMANVRATIPSAEAYYADHGSYAGMTVDQLRLYDSGIRPGITVTATATSYCIDYQGTAHDRGPGGEVLAGPC